MRLRLGQTPCTPYGRFLQIDRLVYGSKDHLKAQSPVQRESRLKERVAELEERIQK